MAMLARLVRVRHLRPKHRRAKAGSSSASSSEDDEDKNQEESSYGGERKGNPEKLKKGVIESGPDKSGNYEVKISNKKNNEKTSTIHYSKLSLQRARLDHFRLESVHKVNIYCSVEIDAPLSTPQAPKLRNFASTSNDMRK